MTVVGEFLTRLGIGLAVSGMVVAVFIGWVMLIPALCAVVLGIILSLIGLSTYKSPSARLEQVRRDFETALAKNEAVRRE